MDGSIDWLCLPHFDSPSVFAAILDDAKGGRFRLCPASDAFKSRQFYWPDTNVLITRFTSAEGVAELQDFMPVYPADAPEAGRSAAVRRLRVTRGKVTFRLECRPGFDYARRKGDVTLTGCGAVFSSPSLTLGLSTNVPLEKD